VKFGGRLGPKTAREMAAGGNRGLPNRGGRSRAGWSLAGGVRELPANQAVPGGLAARSAGSSPALSVNA
jgi:hypothetical protein